GAVEVHAVAVARGVGERGERAAGHPGAGEVAAVGGVVAVGRVVRGDVNGIGGDGNWRGEVHLLPAGCRLIGEGGASQFYAAARPEVTNVGPGVAGPLVEFDAGDVAGDARLELHTQIDGGGIVGG